MAKRDTSAYINDNPTKITLVVKKDELILEGLERAAVLDLKFTGEFHGTSSHPNNIVRAYNNRIIFAFGGEYDKNILRYVGTLKIDSGTVYWYTPHSPSREINKARIRIAIKDDKIQNIKSEWDSSTNKYEEYLDEQSIIRTKKSLLTYNVNGKEQTFDTSGKRVRNKK